MDDFLKSGECVKGLINIAGQLLQFLSNKGFRLTKWISNSQIILDRLPTAELEIKNKIKDLTYENSFKKVLGLLWNVKSDTLKLPSNIKRISNTKRGLLSALCSVFDPLGFVAPCLIEPKLIIQELWQRNIEWDQTLPADLEGRANKWINSVKYLSEIEVPRYYGINMSIKKPELHIFADSSSKAYGCAAYFRVVENNKAKVSFVISKSRLEPLKEKRLSIPKLELQAAVTATRIKTKLLEETNFDVERIYFWSDSKTVLKHICYEKKHFPVYVLHRLDEIRSNSNITDWNYIPTHHNVSDACTRLMHVH